MNYVTLLHAAGIEPGILRKCGLRFSTSLLKGFLYYVFNILIKKVVMDDLVVLSTSSFWSFVLFRDSTEVTRKMIKDENVIS